MTMSMDSYNETGMDIGSAVIQMKLGEKVARRGWNGKGMWLALRLPRPIARVTKVSEDDPSSAVDMSEAYVYMRTAQGGTIPWLCSQADLLAMDWEIVTYRSTSDGGTPQ